MGRAVGLKKGVREMIKNRVDQFLWRHKYQILQKPRRLQSQILYNTFINDNDDLKEILSHEMYYRYSVKFRKELAADVENGKVQL
jgi:hypothetical protein